MITPQRKLRTYAEYALFIWVYWHFVIPPYCVARFFAYIIADLWRTFDKKHSRLVIEHSMDRLGIDAVQAAKLLKDNYRSYALFCVEVSRLRRMGRQEIPLHVDYNGSDRLIQELLAKGKGLIIVTGHLGNWEWGAVMLGLFEGIEGVIARPLDNPLIDKFVIDIREKSGVKVWSKFGALRNALSALKRGKGFVTVIDQDAGGSGIMIPFLGKSASTIGAPADLALRAGSPVLVGAVIRSGKGLHFTLVTKNIHWPDLSADPDTEKKRLLTGINDDLSAIIKEYPEQWIWRHRRWKTRLPE